MRLERVRPTSVQVSLHPLELAGLVTAARWVVTGGADTPPSEALDQLRLILADYDQQTVRLGIGDWGKPGTDALERPSIHSER